MKVLRRRWWWLALIIPAIFGLARLRFDVEVLNLLPPELPVVQGLKLYQRHFANADELVLTMQSPDATLAESAARQIAVALRAQTNLVARALWQPPAEEHPEQMAELLAALWFNQPPAEFARLVARLSDEKIAGELNAARETLATSLSPEEIARLGYDPLGLSRVPAATKANGFGPGENGLASRDGTFRLVFVKPAPARRSYRETSAWFAQLKRAVEEIRRAEKIPADLRVGYTGGPAFVAEISSGMERDVRGSATGTLGVIAILFWLAHRRWLPLLWLVTLLLAVVAGTLALGGFVFGTLNVVSLGFAAILLGLGVDYALVLYQESLSSTPGFSRVSGGKSDKETVSTVFRAREISGRVRREMAPGILWSALTTAGAFALLNFAGLPGLAQLGTLVAFGVLLAAVVMLYGFLPVALRRRMHSEVQTRPGSLVVNPHPGPLPFGKGEGDAAAHRQSSSGEVDGSLAVSSPSPRAERGKGRGEGRVPILATAILFALALIVLWHRFPALDHTAQALSPNDNPAYLAAQEIKTRLTHAQEEPLWLLVAGRDEAEVARRLGALEVGLNAPEARRWFSRVTLPSALWPDPERQNANRVVAVELVARRDTLRAATRAAGFTDEAFSLTDAILKIWQRAAAAPGPFWPTNEANRWLLEKISAHTDTGWLALGIVEPATDAATAFTHGAAMVGDVVSTNRSAGLRTGALVPMKRAGSETGAPAAGAWLTGWPALGAALLDYTQARALRLIAVMLALLAVCLWLAFRTAREMLLSFAALGMSFLLLLAAMSLLGWSWNLMNLMAAPLLLGAGVDYTIHVQLALRRHHGDARAVRSGTGRALWLCAGTTVAGFGSLAWSGNAGLASLGRVCAIGVACVLVVSLYLLPAWWRGVRSSALPRPWPTEPSEGGTPNPASAKPSASYRAGVWRLGLLAVRILPDPVCRWLARVAGALYWRVRPGRYRVVVENLLPALNHDRTAAERAARKLFQEFALKVTDLWRYENGADVGGRQSDWSGWEIFVAAQARGQGVLIVTPHLGNWEIGAAFFVERGISLLVLTQAEPEAELTELRQASRTRRGIETLVVGADAFAFIEIIKRLQAGAAVALLVDRPPPATAVTVELFGRPFAGSIAAAELARASGCAIVPAVIVRGPNGYAATILPEVVYDRATLGDRAARIRLTQEILRAFEPAIRQHVEQWYHFVPVWSEKHQTPNTKHQ